MSHEELCERAVKWLAGSRRCRPVYAANASCSEIPDAVGWSSCWKWHGSTVVECKTSVADFRADQKKWVAWKYPDSPFLYSARRVSEKTAEARGLHKITLPRMGDFRFFLCEAGIITQDLVELHAPDHGLLYVDGRRIRVIRDAKRRDEVNYRSEVRYLRFAINNSKIPLQEGRDGEARTDG